MKGDVMATKPTVPLTEKILEEVKKRGEQIEVWRIYYPMRDEDPIEVTVNPETISDSMLPMEFDINGRKVIVKKGTKPPRPRRQYRQGTRTANEG